MIKIALTLLGLSLGLSACTLTPPRPEPQPDVAPTYAGSKGEPAGAAVSALGWRKLFSDARLQRLIGLALEQNRDLRLAALNVQAAQAAYGIERSAGLPSVALEAGQVRERVSQGARALGEPAGVARESSLRVGVTAFELDLFGRVRALSEAALARYLASEQGRQAAQLALVAAVADAYFAELGAQAQLRLAEHTLQDWQQSLDLALLLQQASQHSRLEVAQARSQVAQAEADLQARQRALASARHTLNRLVGTALPSDLPPPLPLDQQMAVAGLPPGLPSELLLQRPDLRQAEQLLVAANADIGAARAAFFPRLSLTAAFGYASPSLGSLFESAGRGWRFTPQISQPLFNGGRLRAELDLSKVRQSEAVTRYEDAIQQAFREVADALAGVATYDPQIAAQQRAVQAEQQRVELSTLRYRAGLQGRLELLDAQRQLYAAQQALLELRRARNSNIVTLYKALGGGLHADSPAAAGQERRRHEGAHACDRGRRRSVGGAGCLASGAPGLACYGA